MAVLELLLEGRYNYLANGKKYSEESFWLKKEDKAHGNFILLAESLTRTRTGEFLKVNVEYNFTPKYDTNSIKVVRSMGPRESTELVKVDHKEKSFEYRFVDIDDQMQKETLNFSNYVHLATPCFATSMLMTQMKKIDPVHRTQYSVYTSRNIWEYDSSLVPQEIYIELQELEATPLKIAGNELKSTHCKMLQVDPAGAIATEGDDVFLSKFHSIPYKGIFDNGLVIEIEALKNYQKNLHKML